MYPVILGNLSYKEAELIGIYFKGQMLSSDAYSYVLTDIRLTGWDNLAHLKKIVRIMAERDKQFSAMHRSLLAAIITQFTRLIDDENADEADKKHIKQLQSRLLAIKVRDFTQELYPFTLLEARDLRQLLEEQLVYSTIQLKELKHSRDFIRLFKEVSGVLLMLNHGQVPFSWIQHFQYSFNHLYVQLIFLASQKGILISEQLVKTDTSQLKRTTTLTSLDIFQRYSAQTLHWGHDRHDKYLALHQIANMITVVSQLPFSDAVIKQTIQRLFNRYVVLAALPRHHHKKGLNFWHHGLTTSSIDALIKKLLGANHQTLELLLYANVSHDFMVSICDDTIGALRLNRREAIDFVLDNGSQSVLRAQIVRSFLKSIAASHYRQVLAITHEPIDRISVNNSLYISQARKLYFKDSSLESSEAY